MAPFVVGSQKPEARDNTTPLEQRLGLATAVVMPILEIGALGYVTWVVCYLICIQYLLNPSTDLRQSFGVQPRRSTGIAIIVVYAILLFCLMVPFLRLLQVIWAKPDLLSPAESTREKKDADPRSIEQYDAYICDYEGLPLFCDKCRIFKPDRTHHCKELGRCVRKMDHFCPWAGGIIGETTHKYFMQFVGYTALYTTFIWIVVAIFLADRLSKTGSRPGPWIGALVLGVLFCIFAFTMSCMTGYNLCINYTSVEAIQRGGVSNIAFLITRMPHEPKLPQTPPTSSESDVKDPEADDDWPVLRITQRSGGRSFVVMQTKPFQHPWSTTMMQGWTDTMGASFLQWVLPIQHSPSKKRSRSGEFRWGEVVYDMAKKYQRDNPGARLALLEGRR
ncbi:DHHC palmitoyltransferase-domain-containing protein [Paraphoma chrysanthemicola]|uniref:Palmitoyltransferase n=1 Tax=Paraphoma chrysanthemicola TaxID=798071 RepID=A0A8K0REQ0_9PLEO|nr:DHHC palmitoyltransferase-domain-containing protein [Paraphoma chrysanthemicola]